MEELSPYSLHLTALFPIVMQYQIPTLGDCHSSFARNVTTVTAGKQL